MSLPRDSPTVPFGVWVMDEGTMWHRGQRSSSVPEGGWTPDRNPSSEIRSR